MAEKPGAKVKALVVEDEALIRMTTSDMLWELGFESLEAANASDALAVLLHHPDIGVLITDLELPGMSGGDLVRRARELHPNLKIIVASGHASEQIAARPELEGVALLDKPFDSAGLRRAVEAA